MRGGAHADDSRQSAELCEVRLEEGQLLRIVVVRRCWQRDPVAEHVVGEEAGVDVLQLLEGRHEQAGADQQQQSQGDLADNQGIEASSPTAITAADRSSKSRFGVTMNQTFTASAPWEARYLTPSLPAASSLR